MSQHFKGDDLELKIEGTSKEVFSHLLSELSKWFDNAYQSAGLGAILYDNELMPLSRTIARDIFIKNYGQILEKWEYIGSFESYLFVFMQIFGPSTIINFEKLAPAALKIDITTNQTELSKWLAKLGTNDYVSDHLGNHINLRSLSGIGDFYEVQSVLDSLNPAGIYLLVDFKLTTGA